MSTDANVDTFSQCMSFPRSKISGQTWTEPDLRQFKEVLSTLDSDKLARRQQHGLMERLQRAEQALNKIKAGKKADLPQLTAQSQALLDRHKVAAYLQVTWTAHTTQTKRYLKRGRHGPDSPYEMVTKTIWQMTVTRLQDETVKTFTGLVCRQPKTGYLGTNC